MDEQGSESGKAYSSSNEQDGSAPRAAPTQHGNPKQANNQTNTPEYVGESKTQRKWNEFKNAGMDRHFELILTVAIVVFAGCQLLITYLNAKSSSDQIGRLITAADRIEDAADSFSRSSADISRGMGDAVDRLGKQAKASQKGASAAAGAASTAKDALHISERAYLTVGQPQFDFAAMIVRIPLINSGHIPSGKTVTTRHEVTVAVHDPSPITTLVEAHWQRSTLDSVAIGSPYSFDIPIPGAVESDINSGKQQVSIAGDITYNDGFNDTAAQTWRFCMTSRFDPRSKRVEWVPCDPNEIIPKIMFLEKYPQGEIK